MTFSITEITRCAGNNHWTFTATANGETRVFELQKSDMDMEPGELKSAALNRIRSALLEANASTFAQARTALINQNFKI
jgi:hypothetical protein